MPTTDMIRWENGELDHNETVELFQKLITAGIVWSLQGCYGRQAQRFIESGECHHGRTRDEMNVPSER